MRGNLTLPVHEPSWVTCRLIGRPKILSSLSFHCPYYTPIAAICMTIAVPQQDATRVSSAVHHPFLTSASSDSGLSLCARYAMVLENRSSPSKYLIRHNIFFRGRTYHSRQRVARRVPFIFSIGEGPRHWIGGPTDSGSRNRHLLVLSHGH